MNRAIRNVLVGALALASGCATTGSGLRASARHEAMLQPPKPDAPQPVQVARGPVRLLQVAYEPAARSDRATIWVSSDPACPFGATAALAEVTPFSGWYGDEEIGAGSFLCAATTAGLEPARLIWWSDATAGLGAPSPR